ncbi:MAG: AAA family ATPase [Candidatus Pacebacteria bacterium]|nr:AAA family ATPase [Candidatus Paceibacterota bacterium]
MKQKTALDILKTGKNIFLTGSAGTGKTFLLREYMEYLKERGVSPAVVAPTGIAASHLNGITIHSFFGLGIIEDVDERYLDNLLQRKYLHQRLSKLKVLLIDEISMVSPKIFEAVDKILKAFKFSNQPFGGVQIIVSGDFFQLPPITRKREQKKFAWQSPIWKDSSFSTCYLEEKFRQDDDELIKVLDEIRGGDITKESYTFLKNAESKELDISFRPTKLYTHNMDVDRINQGELNDLGGKRYFFESINRGTKKRIEKIFKSSLILENIELKKEAVVIFIKNNLEKGYINGTIGKIVDFNERNFPIVKIFSGKKIEVEQEDWMLEDDNKKIIASVSQIPLRLAWAITVHKSQGMSLDVAEIDLSKTFETGQGYVALSRVKNSKGLKLHGFNQKALEVDSLILFVDKRMQDASIKSEDLMNKASDEQKQELFINFLEKIGASLEVIEKSEEKKGKDVLQKNSTYDITASIIDNFDIVEELAEERGFSMETAIKHLKILKDGYDVNLERFKPEKKIFNKIKKAVKILKKDKNNFTEGGVLKLKSVFDYFNEEIDYQDIKLALVFL